MRSEYFETGKNRSFMRGRGGNFSNKELAECVSYSYCMKSHYSLLEMFPCSYEGCLVCFYIGRYHRSYLDIALYRKCLEWLKLVFLDFCLVECL